MMFKRISISCMESVSVGIGVEFPEFKDKSVIDICHQWIEGLSSSESSVRAATKQQMTQVVERENAQLDEQVTALGFSIIHRGGYSFFDLQSTFTPEDWSDTFMKGVFTQIDDVQGKELAEIGCGIGWISILVAIKGDPHHITAGDINPEAITVAQLNGLYHSLNEDGSYVMVGSKRLCEKLTFVTSNLLSQLPKELDMVIGCIPQVLNTDERYSVSDDELDVLDKDYLNSLSNYCGSLPGPRYVVENELGLGLNAQALELIHAHLKPGNGRIVLNFGGRLGFDRIQQLLLNKGYRFISKVSESVIKQAEDTRIQPLVTLENTFGFKCAFYGDSEGSIPLTATEALIYQREKKPVFHNVYAILAESMDPQSMAQISTYLNKTGVRLSIPSLMEPGSLKMIASFCDDLASIGPFPYEATPGLVCLRQCIAGLLSQKGLVPKLSAECVMVYPSKRDCLEHFQLLDGGKKVRHESPCSDLNPDLDASDSSTILVKLTSYPDSSLLSDIVAQSGALKKTLIIDVSALILEDIESSPILFESLPNHVHIIAKYKSEYVRGLSQVFLFSQNACTLTNLVTLVELTYSRARWTDQRLLFHELKERSSLLEEGALPRTTEDPLMEICKHPALEINRPGLSQIKRLIHLDYGENEYSAPPLLKGLVVSQLLRDKPDNEIDLAAIINGFCIQTLGIEIPKTQITFGQGVSDVYRGVAALFREQGVSVIFPRGSYGEFRAVNDVLGVSQHVIETAMEYHFKYTVEDIMTCLTDYPDAQFYLNVPYVNPTAVFYSKEELGQFADVIKAHNLNGNRAGFFIDTIFLGLAFESSFLEVYLAPLKDCPMVITGGSSKQFSGGGLRFAWVAGTSLPFMTALSKSMVPMPPYLLNTMASLYSTQLASTESQICEVRQSLRALQASLSHMSHFLVTGEVTIPIIATMQLLKQQLFRMSLEVEAEKEYRASMTQHLMSQSGLLKSHYDKVVGLLEPVGWTAMPAKGGLFCTVFPPQGWLNKQVQLEGKQVTITPLSLETMILEETGVLVNGPGWSDIPGADGGFGGYRIVLSVPDDRFVEGIKKIKTFSERINK